MASELVTFNVSGKARRVGGTWHSGSAGDSALRSSALQVYTVLREPTLSLHPDSLLTQLAEEKKVEKEIFVEGLGGDLMPRIQ